jgi:hypothetical protein
MRPSAPGDAPAPGAVVEVAPFRARKRSVVNGKSQRKVYFLISEVVTNSNTGTALLFVLA